ncbi:MAG: DUF4838 domain-containing protein [Lentisphaeria bacterium]|nr:DUF4838 domain-containing protein [Lentisphaeria bacterium]
MRFAFVLALAATGLALAAAPLKLAENGKTDYKIVVPASSSAVDKFAAKELQFFLKKITSADFPVVSEGKSPAIFIGGSEGKSLPDQENVIETRGKDLHLYGGGLHGALWATYELIENELGCIFFNAHGDLFVPEQKTLVLPEMKKRRRYAFASRSVMNWFYVDKATMTLALYRNRQNLLLHGITQPRYPGKEPGIVCRAETFVGEHSFSMLLPSGLAAQKGWTSHNAALPFLKDKQYFKEHPEYFSMDGTGKRVPNWHLCLSNPELRKELTKNALLFYAAEKKRTGVDGVIQISANDIAYRLCFCKPCIALEEKYGTRGGPLFDFITELARNNPQIKFRTTAYQRSLTQTPPGIKVDWPKNLQLIFAPINGDFARSFADNKKDPTDFDNFVDWTKITRDILVWYYPNPYNRDREKFFIEPPTFILDRVAADIRLMAEKGIEGTYFEHDSGGIRYGTNFSELQTYVMLKLFQDPSLDPGKLAEKYIRAFYGPAAEHVLKYHDSLASAMREFVEKGGRWNYRSMDSDFLDKDHLMAWDKMLDDAEKAAQGVYGFRVRLLRLGLDSTIVTKLGDAAERRIGRMRATLDELKNMRKVNVDRKGFEAWSKTMLSRGKVLPLPSELAALKGAVVMETPEKGKTIVFHEGANLNRAFREEAAPGKSFAMGLFDKQAKKYLARRSFAPGEIRGKAFNWYLLSKTPLAITRGTVLNGGSWWLNFNVGNKCIQLDDSSTLKQKWYFFVSLKADKDALFCDRILIVPAESCKAELLRDLVSEPLPPQFDGVSGVVPVKITFGIKNAVADPRSADGKAFPEAWDGKANFRIGLYERVEKKYVFSRFLKAEEVPADGAYHLVLLSKKPLPFTTGATVIGGRWTLLFRAGDHAVPGQSYHVFLSLLRENGRLLCDKVFLVPAEKTPETLLK